MRQIDTTYKLLALAPSRRIYCKAIIGVKDGNHWTIDRTYTESDSIVSAVIDQGAASGGLQIGRAFCAKLTLRLLTGATISQTDQIIIRVGFIGADGAASNWVPLGTFYVDTIKVTDSIITVTAYDRMLRAQKYYNSALTYPCNMSAVLDEICNQMGITTVQGFALPIDPVISTKPVKGKDSDGNTVYYTRREVLSYIASACAGNFYFNGAGQLDLTRYEAVTESIDKANSILAEISADTFAVSGVAWIDNGISHSRYDEDTAGLMEFENPLPFASKPPILDYIDGKLKALSYNAATIKRQGCGWYELGDIVTAQRKDGTSASILISGINYRVENGGFTEKIYSLASSDSEDNFTTGDVTGQQVPQSVAAMSSKYVSLPLTNPAAVTYDAIERGLLSVDFNVDGTDSAVVFAGAQQCTAASAGTVDISYKVDGATQDFKPSQVVAAGKNILPHYLAMALNKGKHNFAVYITSADGRGSTPINGLAAALSGQISGIKINTPPNDNLLLYFGGVPAGTTITLPNIFSTSTANKSVDWGDGTAAETTKANASVEHTYAYGGDYVVTMQSTDTRFLTNSGEDSSYTNYLTGVYFPDSAQYISVNRVFGNCPNLETIYLGKSATYVALILTNCAKLTSLIFPDTAVGIGVTLTGTSVTDITIPAVATTARAFNNLTSLQSIAFEGALLCSCKSDTSLKTVRMTDKINAIPDTCFSNCTSLADIDLPKTITKIGANAFSRCAKLPSLPLLPELTSIGVRAFEGCSGLSDAAFGDKLASMGIYAFHNCVSLSSVDIPSGLVTLPEGAFQACTGLASVSHGGLMTIGAKAFEGCTQLAGFEFPSGLVVGSQAFAKTGFESVDVLSFMPLLTSGTTAYGGKYNIGAQAFANCTKLSEVSGYKYKFSVGLRVTESTKEDGVWTTTETDMGEMADARGIYNAMGATSDSVFSGTALKSASNYLKEHPEYSNESTDTYRRTYTAYDITSTD